MNSLVDHFNKLYPAGCCNDENATQTDYDVWVVVLGSYHATTNFEVPKNQT